MTKPKPRTRSGLLAKPGASEFVFELLDTLPDVAFYIFDESLTLIYINRLAAAWLGRPAAEMVGLPFDKLYPDRQETRGRIEYVLRTGETVSVWLDDVRNPATGAVQSWQAEYHRLVLPDGRTGVACRGRDATAQRQVEKRVESERARLLKILMGAPMAVCVYRGPDFVFDVMNQAYSDLFANRFRVGQAFRDKGADDPEVQKYLGLLDTVRRTKEPVIGNEVPIRYDWDGTGQPFTRIFNFIFQPSFDENGEVESVLNFATDVTEFVNTREAALDLEEKASQHRDELFQLLQGIPAACAVIRYPSMVYELANRTTQEWIGKGNIVGRHAREVLPEFERQGMFDLLERVCRSGQGERYSGQHLQIEQADGTVKDLYLNSTYEPVRNVHGRIDRMLAFSVDVTEQVLAQRKAEQLADQIEQSNNWLREVLNNKPTPTLLVEKGTGKVIFANKAADRLAGGDFPKFKELGEYGDAFACTYPDGRRIPPDELPSVRASRGEVLHGFEMEWETPDGLRTISCHSAMLEAMFGYPEVALVSFYDITELRQAQREAVEAVRIRDEYMSVASHELRTPLTSIMLQAEMLRGTAPDSKSTRALERIVKHGTRINQMVTTLLDVSRISSGQVPLDPEEVDLGSVVTDIVGRLQVESERAECPVTLSVSSAIGQWDRNRVEQIVTNLITNAFKYGKGSPVIVSVHRRDHWAVLSIRDFGIGIRHEDKERIFEQFQRVGPKNYAPGLGLGLWIVHKIVSALGGRIHVESEPNEGSTFIVELPTQMGE